MKGIIRSYGTTVIENGEAFVEFCNDNETPAQLIRRVLNDIHYQYEVNTTGRIDQLIVNLKGDYPKDCLYEGDTVNVFIPVKFQAIPNLLDNLSVDSEVEFKMEDRGGIQYFTLTSVLVKAEGGR